METNLGSCVDRANARYSADTLPRGDRMAAALRPASSDNWAKYRFRRGTAKSTKARTLGTEKRPCGASRCAGSGGETFLSRGKRDMSTGSKSTRLLVENPAAA